MIHFAQTTSFAAARARGGRAARPGSPRRSSTARRGSGSAGSSRRTRRPTCSSARWATSATTTPASAIRPATTPRASPGIGHRLAYPGIPAGGIGGDIAGKAAAALALAYDRTHNATYLTQARQWYAAGQAAARAERRAARRLLPRPALEGLDGRRGRRALPLDGRAALPGRCARATCDSPQSAADGTLGVVDSFASFAAADLCGALGAPAARERERPQLRLPTPATSSAGSPSSRPTTTPSACPGFFTWGTTAQNGASGALAGLAGVRRRAFPAAARSQPAPATTCSGETRSGAASWSATDPAAPIHPHHWASVFGKALPTRGRGRRAGPDRPDPRPGLPRPEPIRLRASPRYEDRRADYVTSEPALDYAAATSSSAMLQADCSSERGCRGADPPVGRQIECRADG